MGLTTRHSISKVWTFITSYFCPVYQINRIRQRTPTHSHFPVCMLLYVMSLLGRRLAVPFSSHQTLVQLLILFNPNLIGLAHHAQSDIVFAFIFTVILYLINRILITPHNISRTSFLLLGGLTGLLCLTRHIGLMVFNSTSNSSSYFTLFAPRSKNPSHQDDNYRRLYSYVSVFNCHISVVS